MKRTRDNSSLEREADRDCTKKKRYKREESPGCEKNSGKGVFPSPASTSVTKPFPAWDYDKSNLKTIHKQDLGFKIDHCPRFFKPSDAKAIFRQLEETLPPYLSASKNEVRIFGKVHKIPRRQAAFGDPGLCYNFSGVTVPANPWIPLLEGIRDLLVEFLKEKFNFVLVNRYKDGSNHIGEHRDDEKDLVPQSSIASLSFGQKREFVFKHKDSRGKCAKRKDIKPVRFSLDSGCLLVMRYPTNTNWYHSLPIRKTAPGPRISLTFRTMKRPKAQAKVTASSYKDT